jgi:predicted CoA-binding protein
MSDAAKIQQMLTRARTIAVVGLSDRPGRASHAIARYLAGQGYQVLGVNPGLSEWMGKPVYPSLEAAHAAAPIDLVDVFRDPQHVPAIVADVIRLRIPYLWLQDGVVHPEAVAEAERAGVVAVQNDCIYRRHAAL